MSFYRFLRLFILLFLPLCAPCNGMGDASVNSSESVALSVQVYMQEEHRQEFLHGAKVSIQPVSGGFGEFPIDRTTGNGGLADFGYLPTSNMVGEYRIIVSHAECGELEARHFVQYDRARPQRVNLAFQGPCD